MAATLPKCGWSASAVLGGDPALVPVGIVKELLVAEVAAQQAELPQVVGNVLANVAHGAIRPHNDFGVFVGTAWPRPSGASVCASRCYIAFGRSARTGHHPAALVLALSLEVEHALVFELLKGQVPEMQAQNFALARQEVVLDVEAVHGFQMPPQNRRRDELSNLRYLIISLFDSMEVSQVVALSSALSCSYHCETRAYRSQQ